MELIGPSGAGKTTLAEALRQQNHDIHIVSHPDFRALRHIPFFLRHTLPLMPDLACLQMSRDEQSFDPRDLLRMVILGGWHRKLKGQARNGGVLLLDQGPVYMLAWFLGFGSLRFRNVGTNRLWKKTCKQWTDTLDMVVWIDAPDETLVKRVRSRQCWHGNKERSDLSASRFLAHWRSSLEYAVSSLIVGGKPTVLRVNSGEESPEVIVDRISVALGLKSN